MPRATPPPTPNTLSEHDLAGNLPDDVSQIMQKAVHLDDAIQQLAEKGRHLERREGREKGWSPTFDLYRLGRYLYIDLEVPGVPASSIQVTSPGGRMVSVEGHKPVPIQIQNPEGKERNRAFGPFASQFTLPEGTLLRGMEQRLEHGVLHLKIKLGRATPGKTPTTGS
ncbi:MAG: Hsp20 family protein [Deltaproteobacteria bacterium]|nr:Hsp20 family protein [Deltaproteobacteria bacterium]